MVLNLPRVWYTQARSLQDGVDAPIVGTTNVEHLEEAVAAVELALDDSDVAWLEEPYEPLPVAGHE